MGPPSGIGGRRTARKKCGMVAGVRLGQVVSTVRPNGGFHRAYRAAGRRQNTGADRGEQGCECRLIAPYLFVGNWLSPWEWRVGIRALSGELDLLTLARASAGVVDYKTPRRIKYRLGLLGS